MSKDLKHERLYRTRPSGGSSDEWEVWDGQTNMQCGDLFWDSLRGEWEWHYMRDGKIICGDIAPQQYQAMNQILALLEGEITPTIDVLLPPSMPGRKAMMKK